MFYSSNACKNQYLKNLPKSCCTSFIICCIITLNEKLTCGKSQLCTHDKSWDMDILKSDCYCILCSIALMHVKIQIKLNYLKIIVHHWLFVV